LGGKIRFAETYEYILVDEDKGTIGISEEACDKLGDIYLVDLPEIGKEVKKGDEVGVIESVKAASDVYAPVSGKIIAINDLLVEKPELISEDPLDKGWIFKIEISDKSELDGLMDQDDFKEFVKEH
jgi:glycine cleavage system H protein